MRTIKSLMLCGVLATPVAGCGQFGLWDTVSGNRATPDEFRVVTRKPLQMPGGGNLPTPRLGERSPLEYDPQAEARAALTGETGSGRTGTASSGERALVAAAAKSGPTTTEAASLAEREKQVDSNKPYEPPSVSELFGGTSEEKAEVLDPNAEARRLRTDSRAVTPVNPRDVPVDAAEAAEGTGAAPEGGYVSPGEKYEPQFPYGNQRKGS